MILWGHKSFNFLFAVCGVLCFDTQQSWGGIEFEQRYSTTIRRVSLSGEDIRAHICPFLRDPSGDTGHVTWSMRHPTPEEYAKDILESGVQTDFDNEVITLQHHHDKYLNLSIRVPERADIHAMSQQKGCVVIERMQGGITLEIKEGCIHIRCEEIPRNGTQDIKIRGSHLEMNFQFPEDANISLSHPFEVAYEKRGAFFDFLDLQEGPLKIQNEFKHQKVGLVHFNIRVWIEGGTLALRKIKSSPSLEERIGAQLQEQASFMWGKGTQIAHSTVNLLSSYWDNFRTPSPSLTPTSLAPPVALCSRSADQNTFMTPFIPPRPLTSSLPARQSERQACDHFVRNLKPLSVTFSPTAHPD